VSMAVMLKAGRLRAASWLKILKACGTCMSNKS
jgi:hypothetical protein